MILHDTDPVLAGSATNDVLHWAIFDIPGTATGLPADVANTPELPDGARQLNNIAGSTRVLRPLPSAPGR